MLRILGLFLALGVVLAAGNASAANRCVTPANVTQLANEIAAGVNASRRSQGLAPLGYHPALGQAAMKHACDMSVNAFFGHDGSDRSNVHQRVQQAGYADCLVAENLAWGYPTSAQIIGGWMNSPGHRSNMLHPRATEMGIAVTQGSNGPNWVLVLAKRCG